MSAIEKTFALLVEAAVKGERCPMGQPHGPLHKESVTTLTRNGSIRIEISGLNWRTVTILRGEHAGCHTMRDPTGAVPSRIVDAKGARRTGEFVDRKRKRSGPSKPRDYGEGCGK